MVHSVDQGHNLIDHLAEEFVQRLRGGEQPVIAEYAQRFPELAERICALFPTLVLVEGLKPDSLDGMDTWPPAAGRADDLAVVQLGDFRVIREVGRGGMGVVYEAEQVSLGRRVALKVLPKRLLQNEMQRKRFLREARAAARLHHTNIVPVFGVGEQAGVLYYVMQFIQGQALDDVLAELKRQRASAAPANEPASQMAQALLTGAFRPGSLAEPDGPIPEDESLTVVPSASSSSSAPLPAIVPDSAETSSGRSIDTAVHSGAQRLAGDSSASASPGSRAPYWQSVAQVGQQVAQALEYAHQQGIVHRDIKPANLLLDTRGTVWVTDFGLAKAEDQQDLTQTGDVLGTLRYMSPEQFHGRGDAKCDVYSLGMTLYELLALRPAHDGDDRARLVHSVLHDAPPKLRALEPLIPRDLETIVQMAIDRDPAHRYQTAGELAADLQRYLADEPIRARRLSPAARLIRWCRKNRAIAALIGLAASLLVLVVLILFVSQIQLTHQRNQLRGALGQSLVAEARFRRASGEMGQRAEGLRNLVAAAQYRPAQELRDDAIRCLALHDLDTEAEWPAAMSNPTPDSIAFDPPLSHYVSYGDETVEIRRTPGAGEAAGQVVQRLPLGKLVARAARFSRDGSVLAVRGDDAGTSRLIVWRWREARQLLDVENAAERAFDVDDSGERLVCGLRDGTMRTYDLITGAILAAWKLPHQPNTARFEQAGPRVACSIPEAYCVQVYDSRNGDQHHEIPFGEDIYALAWHPDGDRLAVGRGFDVCVVRLQEPSVPAFLPIGHRWMIHAVEYHPSGEFLVSHCLREGVTRLWDMRTRRELLLAQGNFIRFDETGAALALLHTDRLKRTRFLGEAEYQTLADGVLEGRDSWRAVFHPTLPVIIDCGRDGIRCWDIRRRRLLAAMPREMIRTACFEPATHDLLTAGDKGLRRWKLEIDRDVLHAAISPPQTLVFTDGSISAPTTLAQGLCSTPDGSFRVAAFKDHPYLYLQEVASARIRRLPCNSRIAFVAISPTGRWIAAGNYQHPGFYVWDAQRDQPAKELDAQSNAGQVAFSPDGKWLIACANDRYLLFEVGSWRLHAEIARPTLVEGSAAFSPNSQVLALSMGPRVVQIREVAAGRILATLDSGRDPVNFLNVQFHPQHGDIISAASGAYGIRLWNLAQTRRALAEMKLDW